MTKTTITYVARKTGKNFTLVKIDEEAGKAVIKDEEDKLHLVSISTLKKTYKKVVEEVEIEEPKTEQPEEKNLTKHQEAALKNIRHGYNWVVGGVENDLQDGNIEEFPDIEELFEDVYDEVMSCTFAEGFCDTKGAPICMKFAGKAFIREQLANMFRNDGYDFPEELAQVPEKKPGHSNIVDGERINLRLDDAEVTVNVRAFTGMLIGTFKVEKQTKTTITVKTAKGMMKFDKTTGLQIDANNEKFANRIEI